MKVRFVDDDDKVKNVLAAVKKNGGYCPCRLEKTADTKCMCAEFKAAQAGEICHCGLYYKVED